MISRPSEPEKSHAEQIVDWVERHWRDPDGPDLAESAADMQEVIESGSLDPRREQSGELKLRMRDVLKRAKAVFAEIEAAIVADAAEEERQIKAERQAEAEDGE